MVGAHFSSVPVGCLGAKGFVLLPYALDATVAWLAVQMFV